MDRVELILFLLAFVALLAAVAERTPIPNPIFLVAGGLALSFLPGIPTFDLDPDLVFVLFLPPILFSAAYDTSWTEFRRNAGWIGLLSIGCVLFTTCGVAIVAHQVIDGLGWAPAFVLGAIVAPPDAAAATTIFQRLGISRRVVTILEGESLVNDASALVAYRFAVIAVATGEFSLWSASMQFVVVAIAGVAIGLAAGWVLNRILPVLGATTLTTLVSLLAPAAIYLLAENVHVSGVLATVTAGLVHGRRGPVVLGATTRVRGATIWAFVVFVCNGLMFMLIGLQIHGIWQSLQRGTNHHLVMITTAIVAAVVITRFIWVFPSAFLPAVIPALRRDDPYPVWQFPTFISWAGLRGVVSLAAALSLPYTTDAGDPFPMRSLIIFLSYADIVATLVGQGLTLAPLTRALGVTDDSSDRDREFALAWREVLRAALVRLDEVEGQDWAQPALIAKLRSHYEPALASYADGDESVPLDGDARAGRDRLLGDMFDTQRRTLIALRNQGVIGDDTLRRVEKGIDLEEVRKSL